MATSLTGLHEFGHAASSATDGFVTDQYVDSPPDLNVKQGRPIPASFGSLDAGVFLADRTREAFLWILDFPRVENVTSRLRFNGSVEDYATARIDLANGTIVNLSCSWNLNAGRDAVINAVFYGTNGAAAMRNVNGSFYDFVAERYDKTKTTTLVEPPDAWGGRAIVAWAAKLCTSRGFDPEIEQVVEVAEVLDAIYESARR